ncbi:MAG: FAD-dependent oxidoreductase [Alphaproteobacteria bacterium]|nr:FAD-dependent oxidoreductase [Alphaproteobacteria bacterium]
MAHYKYEPFDYVTPPEVAGGETRQYQVAIIGAGPIGLAAAIDLALHDVPTVVVDDNNVVSVGSRAICWSKRTLEIFDRLGVGERMLEKGVTWKVGRLFHRDHEVYNFDLLPEDGHKMPAFINLQQYYVEQYLVERAREFPDLIDLRFKNKVIAQDLADDGVTLQIETPDGPYSLRADYVIACDGAGSPTRHRMGLRFDGHTFHEQFLIADVDMPESPFKTEHPERWFWFDPPFHNGQSALLHKQPDNIYRIDLQLGPDADAEEEKKEVNVLPRIRAMVGDKPFTLDWVSVYKFTCARLERFVHGRMIFAGDSAHVVSPFGARGGNGGIQDTDNLCWKLAMIIKGDASDALLETYDQERRHGSDENLLNSSRATNFMTPKSQMEAIFRNETLILAETMPFARKLVNSGRLSEPCSLTGHDLQTPAEPDPAGLDPGMSCPDAPVLNQGKESWLLDHLGGRFVLLTIGDVALPDSPVEIDHLSVTTRGSDAGTLEDHRQFVADRYGDVTAYLIRPDQHIAARFEGAVSAAALNEALKRARGQQS